MVDTRPDSCGFSGLFGIGYIRPINRSSVGEEHAVEQVVDYTGPVSQFVGAGIQIETDDHATQDHGLELAVTACSRPRT